MRKMPITASPSPLTLPHSRTCLFRVVGSLVVHEFSSLLTRDGLEWVRLLRFDVAVLLMLFLKAFIF